MGFIEFEKKIYNYVISQDIDYYEIDDNHYKLPISDAVFCIKDIKRNKFFYDAIKLAIKYLKKKKNKINVIDAGSGTGILGLFALHFGADKCIFIEQNPFSLKLNKQLVEYFNYEKKSDFILGDAATIDIETKFDLLISETIVSNIAQEDFPIIINNLKKYGNKDSIIIPEKIDVEIIENLDNNNHQIHKYEFISNKGLYPQTVNLIKNSTKEVTFQTKLTLYDDIIIKTGDCPLFINKIKYNLNKPNSMFTFKIQNQ